MSKTGDYVQQWLDRGGYDLGYSEYELPNLKDKDSIIKRRVRVWEYCGVTEKEYYGE